MYSEFNLLSAIKAGGAGNFGQTMNEIWPWSSINLGYNILQQGSSHTEQLTVFMTAAVDARRLQLFCI